MNKKTYITPAMEVMNIETLEMMASSIAVVNESGSEMLSNDRRGSWGDLWGGEE
ncbi:MAG: hypothetical protein IKL03_07815 [Bacteroidaceae bacterium]|nr:hypothetical protein [Bacteroidaceae bacterium]